MELVASCSRRPLQRPWKVVRSDQVSLSLISSLADGSAALQQKAPTTRSSSAASGHDRNRLSVHWTPGDATHPQHIAMPQHGMNPEMSIRPGTPLSQIRGFPDATSPAPQTAGSGDVIRQPSPLLVPQPFQPPDALSLTGDGFNGPESLALPQVSSMGPSGGAHVSFGRACSVSNWKAINNLKPCPRDPLVDSAYH